MKKLILSLAALTAPAVAHSAPVYLECRLAGGSAPGAEELVWNITLNEETSQISWTIPASGVATSSRAIFTADEVRWSSLTINRNDLSFTRFNEGIGSIPASTTRGRCTIAQRRNRAF